jgi:hypothetical protein
MEAQFKGKLFSYRIKKTADSGIHPFAFFPNVHSGLQIFPRITFFYFLQSRRNALVD